MEHFHADFFQKSGHLKKRESHYAAVSARKVRNEDRCHALDCVSTRLVTGLVRSDVSTDLAVANITEPDLAGGEVGADLVPPQS